MRYLLDTDICIFFLKGRFELVGKMENVGFDNLFISEVTIAELKFGAEKSAYPERNRLIVKRLIDRFNQLPIYSALDIYAREKARLKKAGNIVDDFDLLIGATAIINEMVLVTNNEKHFERLQSLKVENWIK